jgi:4-hydroxy-tetrahydrodipicolinate synthase
VISVVGHIVPQTISDMVRAGLAGDFGQARALHYAAWHWNKLAFAEGNPTSVKAILESMGICQPYVRLPLIEASEGFKNQVKAATK